MQKFIDEDDIKLCCHVKDCYEAMIESSNILVKNKKISQKYSDEIIEVFKKYGPYFVISPGICLAHSKPSSNVFQTGISLLTLKQPVSFGHLKNDPVSLVFTLASINHNDHLDLLKRIVLFLSDKEKLNALNNHLMTKNQIVNIINNLQI